MPEREEAAEGGGYEWGRPALSPASTLRLKVIDARTCEPDGEPPHLLHEHDDASTTRTTLIEDTTVAGK
ncbi:hypothetical protein TNCT6_29290 [Streptomyces sp. 6-11-2]|nr:hypothetical protein TNCT6_29290 [Streptomyces sp. 6-11-2]